MQNEHVRTKMNERLTNERKEYQHQLQLQTKKEVTFKKRLAKKDHVIEKLMAETNMLKIKVERLEKEEYSVLERVNYRNK